MSARPEKCVQASLKILRRYAPDRLPFGRLQNMQKSSKPSFERVSGFLSPLPHSVRPGRSVPRAVFYVVWKGERKTKVDTKTRGRRECERCGSSGAPTPTEENKRCIAGGRSAGAGAHSLSTAPRSPFSSRRRQRAWVRARKVGGNVGVAGRRGRRPLRGESEGTNMPSPVGEGGSRRLTDEAFFLRSRFYCKVTHYSSSSTAERFPCLAAARAHSGSFTPPE